MNCRFWPYATVLLSALAGFTACSSSNAPTAGTKVDGVGEPRVVVSIQDSAFNPYHDFFYAGSPIYADAPPSSVTPEVLAEFGIAPEQQIQLTRTGNIAADIQADQTFWKSVKLGQTYWFKGTNLIARSACVDDFPLLVPDAGKSAHGVGVSAAALRANPEAVLYLIEICNSGTAEAQEAATLHPAVDLMSISVAISVGAVMTPLPVFFIGTYEGVVGLGKLQFHAAGNNPNFTPIQPGPGAWWTIGVSGIEEHHSHGQPIQSANAPDFVSNFTAELPYCMDCETGLSLHSGTSYSSPHAAGVASRVLLEARRALGHRGGIVTAADGRPALIAAGDTIVTNWDLRRALEEAAYVGYTIADYDPTANSGVTPLITVPVLAVPINDAAPWLQLGWGDLSADPDKQVVAEALAQLGLGTPTRFKAAGFCEHQSALMRFRQAYWGAASAGLHAPRANTYQFCDSALPLP